MGNHWGFFPDVYSVHSEISCFNASENSEFNIQIYLVEGKLVVLEAGAAGTCKFINFNFWPPPWTSWQGLGRSKPWGYIYIVSSLVWGCSYWGGRPWQLLLALASQWHPTYCFISSTAICFLLLRALDICAWMMCVFRSRCTYTDSLIDLSNDSNVVCQWQIGIEACLLTIVWSPLLWPLLWNQHLWTFSTCDVHFHSVSLLPSPIPLIFCYALHTSSLRATQVQWIYQVWLGYTICHICIRHNSHTLFVPSRVCLQVSERGRGAWSGGLFPLFSNRTPEGRQKLGQREREGKKRETKGKERRVV